jgi:hypothetical protein
MKGEDWTMYSLLIVEDENKTREALKRPAGFSGRRSQRLKKRTVLLY